MKLNYLEHGYYITKVDYRHVLLYKRRGPNRYTCYTPYLISNFRFSFNIYYPVEDHPMEVLFKDINTNGYRQLL